LRRYGADDVQTRLTQAEQSGAILQDLQAAPAMAGSSITRAQGVVGSFAVVTPPMPPPPDASSPTSGRAGSDNARHATHRSSNPLVLT
jgi:hypothetical protein